MRYGVAQGIENQLIELASELAKPRAVFGRGRKPPSQLVFAETDVPAFVFYDAVEHLGGER